MEKRSCLKKWREKHHRKIIKAMHPVARDVETTDDDSTVAPDYNVSLLQAPQSPQVDEMCETSFLNRYIVNLTVVSGHNLTVRDITGTSDPYVKLQHGKYKARSSVVNRNLNPVWNEKFVFQVKDLSLPLVIRVYDHDTFSSDDFMGQGLIDLRKYQYTNRQEKVTVKLADETNLTEDLGCLRLELELSLMNYKQQSAYQIMKHQQSKRKKCQPPSWNSILTVTVLSATDLPAMDANGFSDPYCKFKLGSQKYKTKVQPKTLNPEWKEKFDMKLYDNQSKILYVEVWDRDFPAADDFIGHCVIDLSKYDPESLQDLKVKLEESSGILHLHVVITGLPCQEEDISTSNNTIVLAQKEYKLTQFTKLSSLKDVGLLHITIDRAFHLSCHKGSTLNSFVTVEVGNAYLRTQSILDTVDPIWNKTFSFFIKDIHDTVHICVFNERNGKEEFLGQVIIPLLKLDNKSTKTYVLKGKHCLNRTPGTLSIRTNLIYNIVRAGFRTVQPKEVSVLSEKPRFQWKVLLRNIQRVIDLINPILQVFRFIQGILSWVDPLRSTLVVIVFIVSCLLIDLWNIFLVLTIIFMMFYANVYIRGGNSHLKKAYQRAALQVSDVNSENESDFSDLEDYIHMEKDEQKNWRQRFRQLQDILFTVQIATGYVANLSERVRNLLYWTVPFLCWMAIVVFMFAMLLTYHVSLRYIILTWGLYKMTKKLWRPKAIPNNEILDFLSRAPTDLELLQWKELKFKNKIKT